MAYSLLVKVCKAHSNLDSNLLSPFPQYLSKEVRAIDCHMLMHVISCISLDNLELSKQDGKYEVQAHLCCQVNEAARRSSFIA